MALLKTAQIELFSLLLSIFPENTTFSLTLGEEFVDVFIEI
jgi:hypothetical protein